MTSGASSLESMRRLSASHTRGWGRKEGGREGGREKNEERKERERREGERREGKRVRKLMIEKTWYRLKDDHRLVNIEKWEWTIQDRLVDSALMLRCLKKNHMFNLRLLTNKVSQCPDKHPTHTEHSNTEQCCCIHNRALSSLYSAVTCCRKLDYLSP